MKEKYGQSAPEMEWLVMDVMDMKDLPDASFDVAIDKGTTASPAFCLRSQVLAYMILLNHQERWMPSWY